MAAPKERNMIAQGAALGVHDPKNISPEGARQSMYRPFRAGGSFADKPRAAPWAIMFRPFGAKSAFEGTPNRQFISSHPRGAALAPDKVETAFPGTATALGRNSHVR